MKKTKKGFTLTELVIVIAVIAILSAVLVPTFVGLTNKAKLSADQQNCDTFNKSLTATEYSTMEEVVEALKVDRVNLAEKTTQTSGYNYAWEKTTNQFVLLDENGKIVYNQKTIESVDEVSLWVTVKSPKNIIKTTDATLNYFLVNNYTGNFEITTLSNFSTGSSTITGNVAYTTNASGTATIDATINGTLTINAPNATIDQEGSIKKIVCEAVSSNTLNINGFVQTLEMKKGHLVTVANSYVNTLVLNPVSNIQIENNTVISKVENKNNSTTLDTEKVDFTNNGKIETTTITESATSLNNSSDSLTVSIENLAQLEAFRDAVNNGATYEGVTVQLTSNITLNDGWTPIGAFSRAENVTTFSGTFDGNNKTISNLNNKGYLPTDAAKFTNGSTITGKKEYLYGLFGAVKNATIRNLTVVANINIENGTTIYGDRVGIIVGHSYGDLTISNCTTKGSISAYDGVAGIVGGAKNLTGTANTVELTNCTNEATVTGNEKAAGLICCAYTTNTSLQNCENKGNITVSCETATPNNRAHAAGLLITNTATTNVITITSCSNTANIVLNYTIENSDNKLNIGATQSATTNNFQNYGTRNFNETNSFTGKVIINGTTYSSTNSNINEHGDPVINAD